MYLMDAIGTMAAAIPQDTPVAALRIYNDLLKRMEHTPRFLLDNSVIHTAVELTLGRPKVLYEALEHCRVPYPRMWVEWEERGREKLQQSISEFVPLTQPGRPLPQRLGFLIEAKPGGRQGMVTWAWTTPGVDLSGIDVPNVSPISAYFDLDASIDQEKSLPFINMLTIRRFWEDNPIQLKALLNIFRTARQMPSAYGWKYLAEVCKNEEELAYRTAEFYKDVYGEYIMVWAIMMLLTSSRQTVDMHPVDRSKLNKARAKRRDPLLLDHTQVVLHVTDRANGGLRRAPLGHARKSPRVHLVSRYLARRGTKHWLVEPYFRGSGDRVERHVHVR